MSAKPLQAGRQLTTVAVTHEQRRKLRELEQRTELSLQVLIGRMIDLAARNYDELLVPNGNGTKAGRGALRARSA